jgi:UTP15 C terminal
VLLSPLTFVYIVPLDESTLEPLLSFAARYVSHPRYASLIVAVTHKVLDLYASVLGQSDSIDELFLKLHRQVSQEKPAQCCRYLCLNKGHQPIAKYLTMDLSSTVTISSLHPPHR